jgi:hypothetical protein
MWQINFPFESLNLDPAEAARLMGFDSDDGSDIPEPFNTMLREAFLETPGLCSITAGFRIFRSPVINSQRKAISLEDVTFHPGTTVFHDLKQSSALALFIVSAGSGISERITDLASIGDQIGSYIYDLLGSLVVMKSVDRLLEKVREVTDTPETCITHPFSPGSCGWEIGEQIKLFSLFPAGYCGVSLTDTCLMTPVKSLSGMAGLGAGVERKGSLCSKCDDKDCLFGLISGGKSCA